MSKIRINELARELEVKPNVILETLAELGIADKKTHSSSLDDDVALQVRQRVHGEAGGPSAPAVSRHEEAAPEPVRAQPLHKPAAPRTEAPVVEHAVKEAPEAKPVEEAPAAPVRLAPPLRPPLLSGHPTATGHFSPPS